jgi:hypothetical protein
MSWRDASFAAWALLAVAVVVIEATARRTRRLPTLTAAVGALTARSPLRVVLLLSWMWLGWHAFAR